MTTDECETCKYVIINEENKARIKVTCTLKNKTYNWGQYIPCNEYRKKGNEYENDKL